MTSPLAWAPTSCAETVSHTCMCAIANAASATHVAYALPMPSVMHGVCRDSCPYQAQAGRPQQQLTFGVDALADPERPLWHPALAARALAAREPATLLSALLSDVEAEYMPPPPPPAPSAAAKRLDVFCHVAARKSLPSSFIMPGGFWLFGSGGGGGQRVWACYLPISWLAVVHRHPHSCLQAGGRAGRAYL